MVNIEFLRIYIIILYYCPAQRIQHRRFRGIVNDQVCVIAVSRIVNDRVCVIAVSRIVNDRVCVIAVSRIVNGSVVHAEKHVLKNLTTFK